MEARFVHEKLCSLKVKGFPLTEEQIDLIMIQVLEYGNQIREEEKKVKGDEDKLIIHRWEAKKIKETYRLLQNAMNYKEGKTCLHRCLIQDTNRINNVLNGKPNVAPNMFRVDTEYGE